MNDFPQSLNLNDKSYSVERTGSKLAHIFMKIFCQKAIKYNFNNTTTKLFQVKIIPKISTHRSRLIIFTKTKVFSFTTECLLPIDTILITQLYCQ